MLSPAFMLVVLASAATSSIEAAPTSTRNQPHHSQLRRSLKADFDWDIDPQPGFPSVNFNSNKEVVFKYDSPLLYEGKTQGVTIFLNDCVTIGSNAITDTSDLSVDRELEVLVDIDQRTIAQSDYYTAINITHASIGLCLRVDYFLENESVNFHETNLTITLDLTANFALENLEQTTISYAQESVISDVEFPVIAYHCDKNSEQSTNPVLKQGDVLQYCVELDPSIANTNVRVTDILSADLDQENMDSSITHSGIIDATGSGILTEKICANGICNIKTQLDSKWFSDLDPADIYATGIAILAFGSATDPGGRQRFLRAPIIFQERRVQENDKGLLVAYTLASKLKVASNGDGQDDAWITDIAVGGAILGASFCCCCIWLYFFCKCRKAEKEELVETIAADHTEVDESDSDSSGGD